MTDIVESLVWHATDWNGSQLADGEPAKGDPKAGLLRDCAYEIERLREENKKLRKTVEYYAIKSNWEYWLKNQSIASIRAWQTLEELK